MIFDDLRAAWGAPENPDLTPVDPAARTEFVTHWEGSDIPDLSEHSACFALMRSIRNYHINTRGWADIGYNGTICPHGRSIEARGLDVQGAHATGHNVTGYGWCFLVDLVTPPTDEMYDRLSQVEAECEAHSGHALAKHGHRDVASTDCPGDVIEAWVQAGMVSPFPDEPPPQEEVLWLDYSWARPDLTGFAGVVRYLEVTEKGSRPDLNSAEAADLHARGLPIGLYWQAADGSTTRGYDVGVGQAWRANREADALQCPMHVPIFYAVDEDYSPEQVQGFFDGVLDLYDGRPVGVYGSFRIVEWAHTQGIEYAVQTSSWSVVDGVLQVSDHINLFQRRHDVDTGTGKYDELLLVKPFPAWEPGQVLEPEDPGTAQVVARLDALDDRAEAVVTAVNGLAVSQTTTTVAINDLVGALSGVSDQIDTVAQNMVTKSMSLKFE